MPAEIHQSKLKRISKSAEAGSGNNTTTTTTTILMVPHKGVRSLGNQARAKQRERRKWGKVKLVFCGYRLDEGYVLPSVWGGGG